ncbi:rhodanese-like domain-containing protein [Nemania sp. NC0429]|nr:rhodanese-like domain-containing protein [Nemania sp. NC0429]
MDASSPLAAMHPAPAPSWGYQSHSPFGTGNPFLVSNRAAMRGNMQRGKPDYFTLGAIRGSSPSASLAADLSQNFGLDNDYSPRFPTPRRALFTTTHRMGRGFVTTPPIPASSPCQTEDAMDISPVPYKQALSTAIEITSPTPLQSPPDVDMMAESPLLISRPSSAMPDISGSMNGSRRKLGLRRPSLSRTKGHSTSSLVTRPHADQGNFLSRLHSEGQVPSYQFGAGTLGLSPDELFQDSPPQERRPQTANSPSAAAPGTFRKQLQFASLTGTRENRANASPTTGHSRRPSNPLNRPRRQSRRSLSMFESPVEVIKGKTEESPSQTTLQSVMDMEEPEGPILPHFFPDGENDGIPRISRDTFLEFLDGKYNESFDQKIIVDCRFEYEYEGGHIDGAVNYNDKELLARHLFETPMEGKTILIFHCEYSVHRAPRMARHIRAEDRTVNAEYYPHLTYPEVYILEGGYSDFFKLERDRCYPQAYVEMDAKEHANTCERELGKLQQKRKGIGRAKTFAFGHHEPLTFDSPTAPGRGRPNPNANMLGSPILGDYRSPRRMVSY